MKPNPEKPAPYFPQVKPQACANLKLRLGHDLITKTERGSRGETV